MDKLYDVILKNDNLEFRFTIKTNTKENAEDLAIEYLIDSEDYNNQVLSCKTVSIKEISDNKDEIIIFNVYDSN